MVLGLSAVLLAAPARADDDPWIMIRRDLFADRPIAENDATLAIEAPEKAEDSALVPISVHIFSKIAPRVKTLTLVIDHNPAPVVGTFTFGSAAGSSSRILSTRVRFDSFSYLRAVIETEDGELHMTSAFVKAAGGCSATALKDAEEAAAHLGEVRIKHMATAPVFKSNADEKPTGEAQVMIRHPNNSGMQLDAATGKYIAARFVTELDVKRGDDLVFHLEAGIALSSNPNFQFTYESAGSVPLSVTAKDTDGATFNGRSLPPSS